MKTYPRNQEAIEEEARAQATDDTQDIEFKLPKGQTRLRVLPAYDEYGRWFRHLLEHNVKIDDKFKGIFTCADPDGETGDCPICNRGREIYDPEDEEAVEAAKALRPRNQFLFNIIVLGAPRGTETSPKEVRVLKAGVKVKKQFVTYDIDAAGGWADITDLENGVNLTVSRTGEGLNTEYFVTPFGQRSSVKDELAANGVDLEDLELHNLDDFYPPKSNEEMERALIADSVPGFPAVRRSEVPVEVVEPGAPEVPVESPLEDSVLPPTQPTE